MSDKVWKMKAQKPVDYPDCWVFTGSTEEGLEQWRVFRKPDGTYFPVLREHLFPKSGGTLEFDLGDQIVNEEQLAMFREWYAQTLNPPQPEKD